MKILLFITTLYAPAIWAQDFLVVVSAETRLDQLSRFQLKQVYLGKITRLKGELLTPLQVKENDPLRKLFEDWLFNPHFDLDNYWITRKLDAGAAPPRVVGSWALVLAYVERNPGFIGYIPKEQQAGLKDRNVKKVVITQ